MLGWSVEKLNIKESDGRQQHDPLLFLVLKIEEAVDDN